MSTGLASFIMMWTDTLMPGRYLEPGAAGLYNGAAPIAKLLPIFLNSTEVIFPPLAATLYARDNSKNSRRSTNFSPSRYSRQVPLCSHVPVPEATIRFFFDTKYPPRQLPPDSGDKVHGLHSLD